VFKKILALLLALALLFVLARPFVTALVTEIRLAFADPVKISLFASGQLLLN
jgi:hypothetical protein